ncbi:Uncharacterised protein [Mycobacteroides abscessus subsp. abscessus]|nr:Uncharacterised protein [Mycobacteroides abscessus subsp. abscessus]
MGIVRVAVGIRTCQCLTCRGRCVPQRVEFGQPVNIGRELVVLPRLGVDGIDLIQCEPKPIRFLRKLTHPIGAIDQIAPRGEPFLAQFAVGGQQRLDAVAREFVQRGELLLRAHQSQLVVLAVHRE